MNDYFGLGLGLATCLGALIWFEVSNRLAIRKKSKAANSETPSKA
jgi:hypothetical protein